MIGDLPGYDGEVWYNPKGIANILLLSDVENYHQVTYDSRAETVFVLHKTDGNERHFKQSEKDRFYIDTNENLGTTVADNKISYTKRTYKQAMLARKVQNMIGRPSLKAFLKIVENNLLKNCRISQEDVLVAEDILGPNLGSLKGKTVRPGGTHVRTEYHGVPHGIMEMHQDVTLCAGIMFVNQIPFFISISRNIKFGMIKVLQNRKNRTILQAFKNVNAIYNNRGFRITMSHTDNKFEPICGDFLDLGMELLTLSPTPNTSQRLNATFEP
jgi:hypothetical protein